MTRIALLVSAKIDYRAAGPTRRDDQPRRDYFELASAMYAKIINHERVVSRMWKGKSKTALAPAMAQAWHAFRRRDEYDCILTDSEHVGIPLALFFKMAGVRKGHVMIAHRLSTPKKSVFFRGLRVDSHVDKIICYGSAQKDYATSALGIPVHKVEVVCHPADHLFWRPRAVPTERLIASAGLEFRDYPTLIEAIKGVDVNLRIAAASPWSRRPNETRDRAVPSNVAVVSHTYAELRDLYSRSLFVVVPLHDTEFQAGSLVIYEAMAMGRAVIASKTRGMVDALREDVTGLCVPPGDVDALRAAICRLLRNPREAERMGNNARRIVKDGLNLDTYVENIARIVGQVAEEVSVSAYAPTTWISDRV